MGLPDLSGWSLLFIVSLCSLLITFEMFSLTVAPSSLIGYIIAYFTYLPVIWHHNKTRKKNPDLLSPESRLWWLLYLAPLLAIGLMGFAWTSLGPPRVHWIAPLIFTTIVGIANYAVYKSSIDYMIAAYGPYAASATGGNDLARDFLAGIAALYAHPCKFLLEISLVFLHPVISQAPH